MDRSEHSPEVFLDRARRVYERGRLRRALRMVVFVAPFVAWALAHTSRPWSTALVGVALAGVTVGFAWRGQAYGAAIAPGLLAGAVPLLLPAFVRQTGHFCALGRVFGMGFVLSFGGGLAAGAVVALAALYRHAGQREFLVGACVVAGHTGLLGCVAGGAVAAATMALGFAVFTGPAYLGARVHAR
jgi:hypothetical protein